MFPQLYIQPNTIITRTKKFDGHFKAHTYFRNRYKLRRHFIINCQITRILKLILKYLLRPVMECISGRDKKQMPVQRRQ